MIHVYYSPIFRKSVLCTEKRERNITELKEVFSIFHMHKCHNWPLSTTEVLKALCDNCIKRNE